VAPTIDGYQQTLRRLRWLVTSYGLSGLEHWAKADAAATAAVAAAGAPRPTDRTPSPDQRSETASEQQLAAIRERLGDCRRCRLHAQRTQIVFGDGASRARLVFVGEAPGYDEDKQGRPFVGRAGQLLDRMIQASGLHRSEVYICNVIKCRPPQNRNPDADEVAACSPFLVQQLEAIHPTVICALGKFAAQTLLQTQQPISELRGKPRRWRGIPVVATFHPAYLLRNPAHKALAWQDLLLVRKFLQGVSEAAESAGEMMLRAY
jgi:uracil-DNA glycosylase family 4